MKLDLLLGLWSVGFAGVSGIGNEIVFVIVINVRGIIRRVEGWGIIFIELILA